MPVCGQQVQAVIQIIIEKEQSELEQLATGRSDSGSNGYIGEEQRIALRDIKPIHLVREIADGNAQQLVVAESGGINAHSAAGQSICIKSDIGAGADFLESAVVLVAK